MPLFGFSWSQFVQGQMVEKIFKSIFSIAKGEMGKKVGDTMYKTAKDRLPVFLSLSLEDERIWAGIIGQIEPEKIIQLDAFISTLKEHQKNMFRHVVVGIADPGRFEAEKKKESDKEKKESDKEKIVYKELAKIFLEKITEIYISDPGQDNPDEIDIGKRSKAKNILLNGGIILEEPFIDKDEIIKRLKTIGNFIINLFSIEGLARVDEVIGKLIAPGDNDPTDRWINRQNSSWFKRIFW